MQAQFDGNFMSISSRVAQVKEQVSVSAKVSGRTVDDVYLLAAVKYLDSEGCQLLLDAGVMNLAENRLDQLESKQAALTDADSSAIWHYIGRLQSRQVQNIASRVDIIHTLCSESSAKRLAMLDSDGIILPKIFLQVNTAQDPAKDGLALTEVEQWLEKLDESISISGLMTMPEFTTDPEKSRSSFRKLRVLRDKLNNDWSGRHNVQYLSMGTSQDYLVAIEEGATHVRLGRTLLKKEE